MRRYGLIGYPLGHSFSKGFFTRKFETEQVLDANYEHFEIADISSFQEIAKSQDLFGLNVTKPHKESVIQYLDHLDPVARELGAVNCIKIVHESNSLRTIGFNTDVVGFQHSIKRIDLGNRKGAMILGTGGSSKAVGFVLENLDIACLSVSRNPVSIGQVSYEEINQDLLDQYPIIINCTPLGMFPEVHSCPPIPYDCLSSHHLLYDLIYNPEETLFLKKGRSQGAKIKNGLEMLEQQAEASWLIWNDK